jgi:hypothetical protein
MEKCRHFEGKWLDSAFEKREDASGVVGCEEISNRTRGKKAFREASPVCEYERIRATNIAERMELLRTLGLA